MKTRAMLSALIFAFALTHGAFAAEIPLSVKEPAGVDRSAEPVTSGVPLPPGTQTSSWSLWDGNTQIPVQITPLQGTTPWILLDFQVDVGGSGTVSLVLRDSAPSAVPADPVTVNETASQLEVTTGPLRVVVGKSNFNLFESVWFDRNNDGTFATAEQIVDSSGSNITALDATSGATFSGDGVPDLLEWEYSGPLRATLRVDGRYRSGNNELLAYTTRLTFYAGRTDVKIEHVLRNSYQPNERHVKLQSATLKIGGGANSQSLVCSGYDNVNQCNGPNVHWANVASTGLSFDLVPSQWDSNGGIVVPDLSHHGARFVVDFAESLSSTAQQRRADAANSPLFARAPGSWYSEYAEFSTSKFSTLDDEKQAYQLWGWSWTPDQLPDDDHKPNYWISWKTVDTHDFSESDDLWQNLMMFVRTGSRGYWDRSMAWARYHKREYPFRTDGFDYAWDSGYEANPVARPEIQIPLTAADTSYLTQVGIGKVDVLNWGADHLWGWGLVDYYYLTGDKDALNAVADLGEVMERVNGWRVPGTTKAGGNLRRYGRALYLTTRLSEAVPLQRWIDIREHVADLWRQTTDWDDRGFSGKPDACSSTSVTYSTFQTGVLSQAFDRYYAVTGDPLFRQRIIQMAEWQKLHGLDPSCNQAGSGSRVTTDCPTPGVMSHNSCSLHHQIWLVDTLVRGYRYSGDVSLLNRAKLHWDQGSKRDGAGADEVGKFVNYRFDSGGNFYPNNGDLHYVNLLFYDVIRSIDQTPPVPPAGLDAVVQSESQIQLSWSAASDPESGISRYIVYRDNSVVAEPVGTSLTDSRLSESTTFAYQVSAVNGAGMESVMSGIASATTFADSSPPLLVAANSVGDPTTVFVNFTEPVELASSTTTSNYSIDNGITVVSASLGSDLTTVTLTTSPHMDGAPHVLTVNNVKDRANVPNTIPADSQVSYAFTAALDISNLSVASGEPYQLAGQGLNTGELCYIDRTVEYASVPGLILGAAYIMTANDDKNSQGDSFLTFDVNQDVKIYVAHDDRYALKPTWLDEFVDTGLDLENNQTHSLFVKDFPAGTVILGGNSHPSETEGNNMYTVVILAEGAQGAPPPAPTGLQVN